LLLQESEQLNDIQQIARCPDRNERLDMARSVLYRLHVNTVESGSEFDRGGNGVFLRSEIVTGVVARANANIQPLYRVQYLLPVAPDFIFRAVIVDADVDAVFGGQLVEQRQGVGLRGGRDGLDSHALGKLEFAPGIGLIVTEI